MNYYYSDDISTYNFLPETGEMSVLIRQHDWASTPVGPINGWSQSLRMAVALVLSSKSPMFLWWGEELVQFYNDAYRPSLGNEGKHPLALGQCGEQCWPETWPIIKPLIDQVMSGGGGTYSENQLLPIYRNGQLEDVYWTFSYTPVLDDAFKIGGVLVVCQETTKVIKVIQELEISEARFRSIVEQAPMAIGLLKGPEMIIETGNDKIFKLWGKDDSIIGHPVVKGLPEIKDQVFPKLLQDVYSSGKPFFGNSVLARLEQNGSMEDVYLDFTYTPLKDNSGETTGVMVLASEVTEQFNAKRNLLASEAKLRAIIEQAPVATCLFVGKDLIVELANAPMIGYWGKDDSVIGKPLRDALPELVGQPFLQILDDIYRTGEPYSSVDAPVNIEVDGILGTYYFNFTYKPLFNDEGEIFGIINMSIDVTKQILAQKALAESESLLRSLLAASPAAIGLFVGRDLIIEMPNQAFIEIAAKGPDIAGKPLKEVMPELEGQPFLGILDDVFTSGITYQTFGSQVDIIREGKMTRDYYDIIYAPIFGTDQKVYAILEIATNVTESVLARKQIEESQMQLLALFEQSPVAIAIIGRQDLAFSMVNPFFAELLGLLPNQLIGKPMEQVLPEIAQQGFDKVLRQVILSGVPYFAREQQVKITRNGQSQTIYIDLTCQPKKENDGKISGVLVVATDMTQQVLARQKIQRAESSLRGAVELAELGTYEIDLTTGIVNYSGRLKKWFGFEKEEQITLEKAYAAISPADLPTVMATIEKAMTPGSDGLCDMEYTMDESKTGVARILHAQGRVFFNEKGEAATMTGTAQDVTVQRKTQQALEELVQERTLELESANEELAAGNEELASINEEYMAINDELSMSNTLLARSNDNLQQFAYVASHDLQEPLRKIRSFGDLLMNRFGTQLGQGEDYVRRMQSAANRMSALIDDLLGFSRVSVTRDMTETVKLDEVVESVLNILDLTIEESGAEIIVDKLPEITGDQPQLRQLFQNLLSNAIKFRKKDSSPVIQIKYMLVSDRSIPELPQTLRVSPLYHKIDVTDNGIGFEPGNAHRIFQVFQRLHGRSEFAGTGIGLAICEKVVANHGGAIIATSQIGVGSTFSIFLPV